MIDYLFYLIQEKYKQWGEIDVPKVYALAIISTLQLFNVITIVVTALILNLINVEVVNNTNVVIALIVILFINYFYLFQIKGSDAIITKFKIGKTNIKTLKTWALSYVIVTLISLTFVICIYLYS